MREVRLLSGGIEMTNRFEICVKFVLEHETEYNADGSVKVERDPNDPGGVTKYGIDQRSHPNVNVPALTLRQAKEIYHAGEWTKCRCDNLKVRWDLAVFDTAVHIGAGKAARLLQQAVGSKVDGYIGPVTIAHTNGAALDLLVEYLDLRESYYQALPAGLKKHYLRGWLNRLADLRGVVEKPGNDEMRLAATSCRNDEVIVIR